MIYTVDDLCLEYLRNFRHLDELKLKVPGLKIVAFAISNFRNKESLLGSNEFLKWFGEHKGWVEVAVHSYDHLYPPDGDRQDEERWIGMALDELRGFLPKEYGYRSPGWQTTNRTVPILKKLGFAYIAYESKVQFFKGREEQVFNSHLYDDNSLRRIAYEVLQHHAAAAA